jgi:signal transduction histidine kinase
MTLREFILQHPEPILTEWVRFARSLGVGTGMTRLSLLNHSAELLIAIAADMAAHQGQKQRLAKSEGRADDPVRAGGIEEVSIHHAISRVDSGFDLLQVIAEYRALRSSVLDLWQRSCPGTHDTDLEEVVRFNEAIDQAVAEAIKAFTQRVRRSSDLFLAVLGHDMRGPLHSISMLAQLAATEGGDRAGLGESTSRIVATVDSAAHLLDDLLLFTSTRLGAGMPINRAAVDVAELCAEAIAEVAGAYPAARIRLTLEGDASGGDPTVSPPQSPTPTSGEAQGTSHGASHGARFTGEFDAPRLRQAITNLTRNAVQHGRAESAVDVTLRAGPTTLSLSVHNFGRPISPDILPTIFEPLVRGQSENPTAMRRAGSVGLGLYIVREVIAAHGGTVRVESTEAEGTTFAAELPLKAAAAPVAPTEGASGAQ